MRKIIEIWAELENDASASTGMLIRRYSASASPDIFVGLKKPEDQKCIVIKLRGSRKINLSRYQHFKDISVELREDEGNSSGQTLVILLINKQHADVFATLCEDLISGTNNFSNETDLLKEILNRIEKWKSLFDIVAVNGLDKEKQRGLFGELYFLRYWLTNSNNYQVCVQAWAGPESALRDFQNLAWALEIKTTHGNNHQKIQISSERQLDTTNLDSLFLLHLSLEVQLDIPVQSEPPFRPN